MKKCGYRRCDKTFESEVKIYCCRKCKNAEAVYKLRDQKPKGCIGRPKQVYKRLSQLTEEDIRILELVFKKT